MAGKSVEDILEQGIHGVKEINPAERRKFLGTLRERIVLALLQAEVRAKTIDPKVKVLFEEHKGAKLFLNGNVAYSDLSKYMKAANQYGITYTIVNNKEYNSEIGLVLAYDDAVDHEQIYLSELKPELHIAEKQNQKKPSFFQKVKNFLK
ncbi:YueI family protein [Bacillus sp. AGMB 02131]|uniref:YueI family protein n=1 Tax=Peribacillus faecalis TaxID=2772559 RepID=A0A927HCW7_9BACI|nr:YueI family protein [Peribacillus faecalis]MBD3109956.1 YueI family protein [Peribacillus faecalis]